MCICLRRRRICGEGGVKSGDALAEEIGKGRKKGHQNIMRK